MATSVRFALTALKYVAVASAAWAQTAEPSWKPDEATVKSIEATLRLPSMAPWEPGPLDSYARYYKGMMLNGRRVIYGDLLRGQMAKEKPGIYLRDPPNVSTGGGCDQIQLWYDVEAHHIFQIQCYGLG
jgi:hypothetical protein